MIANNEPVHNDTAQRMTWEEMKRAFPREWIVIAEPEVNEWDEVVSGRVFWHGADRKESRRQADILHQDGMALFFTGPLSTTISYAL